MIFCRSIITLRKIYIVLFLPILLQFGNYLNLFAFSEEPKAWIPFDKITLKTGGEAWAVDLQAKPYFVDLDDDKLYFSFSVPDQLKEYLFIIIMQDQPIIILKALSLPDSVSNYELTIKVLCDDDPDLTDTETFQYLNINIINESQKMASIKEQEKIMPSRNRKKERLVNEQQVRKDIEVFEDSKIGKSKNIQTSEMNNVNKSSNWIKSVLGSVEFGIGCRISNNHWSSYWAMTPVISGYLRHKQFMIVFEGLQGDDANYLGISGRSFFHRFSVIPMYSVSWNYFYGALGYGAGYVFKKDVYWDNHGMYHANSKSGLKGMAKGSIGFCLPVSSGLNIWVDGGMTVIDKNQLSYDFGAGLQHYLPIVRDSGMIGERPEKSRLTNILIGSGVVASLTGYVYYWKANRRYMSYNCEPVPERAIDLFSKAKNNDKWAKNFLGVGIGLIISGVLNHYLLGY